MKGDDFYNHVVLTLEEEKEALVEGKKKKWFREKFRAYWEAREPKKGVKSVGQTLEFK